ncbi:MULTISPECIES: carbon-nitrogen hydrolase family protein [unclassified Treponema]|uniref:carbon-nitrogen hydrolase family protein n=1 Tax=unclassified Treponema TaxID=2638727 RepID=UPI0020A529ED|nr:MULTISPECIES: carbon-nitrogen hydrolase family protein [unclassified Treponema]UTC67156.1 carbon-nitrogen hydrolase family protein [Treponema sp. OMZ 789]UTC69886.1 carbon-nitrogen hydrolase family protein [Treponema sp. OMZ 790]UTC72601.1 carbon-nitrogen hydrolase family protein [Treponema sp. OMZ 791]
MKIGLCASENKNNDIDFNIAQIEDFIKKTRTEKPDLLLFGESFLQGFDSVCFEYKKDILTAFQINSEPITKIRSIAKKEKTAIGFGFIENDHGAIFSSYMITGKNGEILCLYKRVSRGWRIQGTCADYREGKDFFEFDFEGKRLGVFICGDLWEDELLDRIISLNPDAFLWPVFCSYTKEEWENGEASAYAERAAILDPPVLFINSLVEENAPAAGGGAFVWHHGKLVKEIPMGKTGFLLYEI